MTLIIPFSAGPAYFLFCLTHCNATERKAIIDHARSILQEEMWYTQMSPGRVFEWMDFIERGIRLGLFETHDFRFAIRQLSAIQRQSHAHVLRQQLMEVLTKNSDCSLTIEDVPTIQQVIDEIKFGNINEAELGFAKSTLIIMIKYIANGDCFQATA